MYDDFTAYITAVQIYRDMLKERMEKTHIEQDGNEGKKIVSIRTYNEVHMSNLCNTNKRFTQSTQLHTHTHTQRARIMDRFQCHANA